jgi:hypothetical protein
MEDKNMEENKKVLVTGTVVVVLVILIIIVVYLFISERSKKVSEEQIVGDQGLTVEGKDVPLEEDIEPLDILLDESDDSVRNLARELSDHSAVMKWLLSKDLIRKFTASVDNIAHGQSPRPHIDFFQTEEKFQVIRKDGVFYIDPESFKRYDVISDAFDSLDTRKCVRLYRSLKPLIQEAYAELGYPDSDFDLTLDRAIKELLKVPVLEMDIELKKQVLSFKIADAELEGMSEAQKHLFRMGPENVWKVKSKLREILRMLASL